MLRPYQRCGVFCAAALLLPAISSGEEPVRDHVITIDDYFSLGVIGGVEMSPNSKRVAYTETRWEPPAEKRNTDIWVVDCKTHARHRLTFDSAADTSPQWSPDEEWVYFKSARSRGDEKEPPYNGDAQVWRAPARGGAPVAVTRVKDGIGQFELSSDGTAVYYTVPVEHKEDAWRKLYEEFDELEYGRGVVEYSQLWMLDLEGWRSEKLIDEERVIFSFAVAPDQKRIAMITTPNEHLISFEGRSRVDIWDAESGAVSPLPDRMWRDDAPSPYGWIESPCWDHAGRKLAFRVDFDGYPSEIFVATFFHGETQVQRVTRPGGVHLSPARMQWRGKSDDLCFIGEERARARVYCTSRIRKGGQGPSRSLTAGDVVCEAFGFGRSGRLLALAMSDVTHGPDVFCVPFGSDPGGFERLTRVNPQVDTWKLPKIQTFAWKGAGDVGVEGILELPPDYSGDEPLPLIVEIHGGPTAASLLHMRFWIYGRVLMASKGFAVLSPNYRGSTGFGDKFMTDLIGHKNDLDVKDILAGVDAVIAKGIADPSRMGVMGWSNGGYLTNCLITQTTRFKAASSGAGISDVAMQWSIEDTPGHVVNFQKGFPWTRVREMREASPLFAVDRVKTPTLFHVGGDDARCPPAHQRAMFRALDHYLGVPTQLVVYPGEGHGLTKYANRKAKMEWDAAWFDRHLLGKQPSESATSD
ncbi:MAG: S9 family peptidase [Planctomycetota bacterium]|nr:S9 family peptidase [Planctomycetota bacterium]